VCFQTLYFKLLPQGTKARDRSKDSLARGAPQSVTLDTLHFSTLKPKTAGAKRLAG
jgi:hypothetical protein